MSHAAESSSSSAVASTNTLVEVRDVTKTFFRGAEALEVLTHVDFHMQPGEFLALMGPSGSGKSTLLNLVAGLDKPSSGTIEVDGVEVTTMSARKLATWRSRHIGFVFQFYNLLPVLTAYQNVELPLLLTKLSKRERREHVNAALEIVRLTDRAKHYPRQLSGGESQRVGIARAIVSDPTIVLADEPTGDLDAKSADEILTLLQRLNSDFSKTIMMVTHDAHAAKRAHEVMHLDKGVLRR